MKVGRLVSIIMILHDKERIGAQELADIVNSLFFYALKVPFYANRKRGYTIVDDATVIA